MDLGGHWKLRVCEHGQPVRRDFQVEKWRHMGSDRNSCDGVNEEVEVVPASQLQGAVDALRELVAAQDDAYASSLSESGRAPEAIERLAKAMDAARALIGGQ